jgi:uncharacterized membrane protein YhaH (DUF805 family)
MMTAVILFAVSDFAPLFIIMVVLVPWLIWGLSFTTERLHDRDKSAWWLGVFFVLPGVLTQIADLLPFTGLTDAVLQKILALAAFAPTLWGFDEVGFLRGTAGENSYGPTRSHNSSDEIEAHPQK